MPTNTPNLNLIKPLVSEHYDVATANANNDILDTAVGDVYTKSEVDGLVGGLAPQATTYTKSEVDTQVGLLAPKANPTFTGTQTLPSIVTNGIKFPATQVPSSDPNTLDDYEEGNFTPVIRGETTAGTVSYTNQQGRYTKIGRLVHFQIYLNWSSLTGTGAMIITGLPFPNGSVLGAVTVAYPNSIALSANHVITAHVNASTIFITSYPIGGGVLVFVQCDASGELMLSGTYMI